jgi:heterodisulfide reductase subunit A-like polyferredoxin
VVVGGGFIGLEMVENLVHRGIKTTLVEMLPQVGLCAETRGCTTHIRDQGMCWEVVRARLPLGCRW